MSEFYSFSQYEVIAELRDSRVSSKEPFSRSYLKTPVHAVCKALELLRTHLIHDREVTGITDEDLASLRSMQKKIEDLRESDLALRRKQDLILRCLHPDGCYRWYLDKEHIRQAYELLDIDPVDGIGRVPLGRPSDEIDRLHAFLKKKVEGLEWKHRARY